MRPSKTFWSRIVSNHRSNLKALAVIPARGGSKGIPRKNLIALAGRPLIVHSIEQAQAARHIDRVVVSTDDPEIEQVALAAGAQVVRRPAEISGDDASSESALLHSLNYLQKTENYAPDLLAFLQCTSPLTLSEDIDGTIDALLRHEADTALAVVPFHYFLWRQSHDGSAVGVNHDSAVRQLRQQREPQYLEAGAVYVMRVSGFLQARHRFFGRTVMHVMPIERCHEIDEITDLDIAEARLRERQRRNRAAALPPKIDAIVFDFDGVMTDNRVLVQDQTEAVWCDRSDGLGVEMLRQAGFQLLVLSKEQHPVVSARCRKLNVPCLQGVDDKAATLRTWLAERGLNPAHCVYLGNDDNDVPCLMMVGCGVVVADCYPRARRAAKIVLNCRGGYGAVRELADLVLAHRRSFDDVHNRANR